MTGTIISRTCTSFVLTTFLTFVVHLSWASRVSADDPPQNPPIPGQANPAKEVSAQQRRFNDFLKQTASYKDFDALAEGLSDPLQTDFDIVQVAGMMSSEANPQVQFAQVFADLRVSRMYAELSEMPADKAAEAVTSLFDSKLKRLQSCWQQVIDREEGKDQSTGSVPISYEFRATSHALFLCGAFASPKDVCQAVDRWQHQMAAVKTKIREDKKLHLLSLQANMHSMPERLFIVNVYVMVLERHGRPLDAFDQQDAFGRNFPGFKKVGLRAWNTPGTIATLSYARSWGSTLSYDNARQHIVLHALRTRVEALDKDQE